MGEPQAVVSHSHRSVRVARGCLPDRRRHPTAGWRRCQSVRDWYARAAARIVFSSHARPTNWRLVGSPRSPKPSGTATAGSPRVADRAHRIRSRPAEALRNARRAARHGGGPGPPARRGRRGRRRPRAPRRPEAESLDVVLGLDRVPRIEASGPRAPSARRSAELDQALEGAGGLGEEDRPLIAS